MRIIGRGNCIDPSPFLAVQLTLIDSHAVTCISSSLALFVKVYYDEI